MVCVFICEWVGDEVSCWRDLSFLGSSIFVSFCLNLEVDVSVSVFAMVVLGEGVSGPFSHIFIYGKYKG